MKQTILKYNDLYKKLYNRAPRDLRVLDNEFVIINDTRLHLHDLELLTNQLEQEYLAHKRSKRKTIMRLISWLRR